MDKKITFATADVDEMVANAKAIVEGLLGRTIQRADPLMLFLESLLSIIAQQRLLIDDLANQNLLYYATGNNLDAMGELVGVKRLDAAAATCTVEITLSAAREKTTIINQGTRVNAGDNVNFALDDAVIFLAGETVKTAKATCLETGETGNGYAAGELKNIVDPQPFLLKIVNTTATEGGADIETDDSYRARIQQAPESFSVAGSAGAYEFFTKEVSTLITDVKVISENPGEVTIWALLEGGEIPGKEMLDAISNHLNADNIRPLTDKVIVKPPTEIKYNINVRYWIARSQQTSAVAIQAAAEKAVEDYISWQRAKLGRDINPTELYFKLRSAGVKRAEISEPLFVATPDNSVAVPNDIKSIFAGLEDD